MLFVCLLSLPFFSSTANSLHLLKQNFPLRSDTINDILKIIAVFLTWETIFLCALSVRCKILSSALRGRLGKSLSLNMAVFDFANIQNLVSWSCWLTLHTANVILHSSTRKLLLYRMFAFYMHIGTYALPCIKFLTCQWLSPMAVLSKFWLVYPIIYTHMSTYFHML